MNDKNAVIDKIINDAQTAAEELKAQARQNAEQIVASAKKSAKAYKEEKLSGKEGRVALALERARSVDALDARRELSACKSALIDEAFTLAAKALKEDKKAYKDYITRVIKENAERSYRRNSQKREKEDNAWKRARRFCGRSYALQ